MSDLLLELKKLDSEISTIINLRWDPIISEVLEKLDLKFVKLKRSDEDLVISKNVLKSNAMIDEGGYGFEPSLYIFSSDSDTVCRIVENIASSMRAMA